jgi:hypothetical protein
MPEPCLRAYLSAFINVLSCAFAKAKATSIASTSARKSRQDRQEHSAISENPDRGLSSR